jgi:hypothetical protein
MEPLSRAMPPKKEELKETAVAKEKSDSDNSANEHFSSNHSFSELVEK